MADWQGMNLLKYGICKKFYGGIYEKVPMVYKPENENNNPKYLPSPE